MDSKSICPVKIGSNGSRWIQRRLITLIHYTSKICLLLSLKEIWGQSSLCGIYNSFSWWRPPRPSLWGDGRAMPCQKLSFSWFGCADGRTDGRTDANKYKLSTCFDRVYIYKSFQFEFTILLFWRMGKCFAIDLCTGISRAVANPARRRLYTYGYRNHSLMKDEIRPCYRLWFLTVVVVAVRISLE